MATSSEDENLQSSRQLPSSMFLQGEVEPQSSTHTQLSELNELSLATERSLAAALTQSLSLASLCVAISFVKWILLMPYKSPKLATIKSSASYIFGVPYKVEIVDLENITTEEWIITSFGVTGDTVLILMTSVCFMSLVFGFVAFLLDFMEIHNLGNCRVTLATSLHILAAMFVATLIAICLWWFLTIRKLFNKADMRKFQMTAILGESFYVTLVALAFAILAVILSWLSMTVSEEDPVLERQKFQREI